MYKTKFPVKKVLFNFLTGRTERLLQSIEDDPFVHVPYTQNNVQVV